MWHIELNGMEWNRASIYSEEKCNKTHVSYCHIDREWREEESDDDDDDDQKKSRKEFRCIRKRSAPIKFM